MHLLRELAGTVVSLGSGVYLSSGKLFSDVMEVGVTGVRRTEC